MKVDFIMIDRQGEASSAKKNRFVVLTDSVLILYDETTHPSNGQYTFEKWHLMLSSLTINSDKENEITASVVADNKVVTMILRNDEHK